MLRRMIRPRALAPEKMQTSQMSAGLVRRSSTLGRSEPETFERSATTMAIPPAKELVQIYPGVQSSQLSPTLFALSPKKRERTIWSSTGDSGPKGSDEAGFRPNTRSCVVETRPSKKRYPTRKSVPASALPKLS